MDVLVIVLFFLYGCATKSPDQAPKPGNPTDSTSKPFKLGKKYKGRFTVYIAAGVKSDKRGKYCLQDKNNKCISPKLNADKVCFLAMQGSGTVDNVKYSWGGRNSTSKHSCAKWGKTYARSHVTRFKRNRVSHSIGSFNNILSPFKSVACPREFANRQKIFVPMARGIILPNGDIHDGVFHCDDRGGAIKRLDDGTYKIDTFLGFVLFEPWKMNDWAKTSKASPFKHTANQKVTHDFYLISE